MTDSSGADAAPLRVACLSVSAALGGSEWVLLDFLRRAARHGIAARLFIPREGPLGEEAAAAGVPVTVAAAPPGLLEVSQRAGVGAGSLAALARGLPAWARTIRREATRDFGALPAVLYSNGFKAHLAGMLVRGPRRVWHLHEFPPEGLALAWRALGGLLPTATIAISRAVALAWRAFPGPEPALVLNGVDLERFRPAERTYWLHDLLSLPRDALIVGMPAVFARWKGHLQVVEAFERAAARLEDAHLVLAGGAIYDTVAERGFAEELVRRVGRSSLPGQASRVLNHRIHFVKHQREPWRLYPEFDVTVHFSTRPEPFGRVLAESLACGVPAVAARAGGPLEIMDEGRTGWLVPQGDTRALADAIVRACEIARAPEGEAMRRTCRRVAQERFSADRFAAEVAAVVRGAAGV